MTCSLQNTYIALGSNIGDSISHVLKAMETIKTLPKSTSLAQSSLYISKAIGPGNQGNYVNAVVSIATALAPLALLNELQTIELTHGRVRNIRWEPRTLDLDILLYGNQYINQSRLTIPHPEMLKRNFVIFPLLELEPSLLLPNGLPLAKVASQTSETDLKKLSSKMVEDLLNENSGTLSNPDIFSRIDLG